MSAVAFADLVRADLVRADLVLEQAYLGGTAGNAGDDPLAALLPVGNQGGSATPAPQPRAPYGSSRST